MRAITQSEWSKIAGGLIPIGGGGGGGGGGGTGGSGGGSGGGSSGGGSSYTEQEFESAVQSAIVLGERGALDSGVSELVFKSLDWANLASQVNSTLFQQGMHDYTTFESSGIDEHDPPGYINVIQWNHVNWHAYDNGGTATPQQAMENLLNDINVNHHLSIDHNTTDAGVYYNNYEGGWNYDPSGGAFFIPVVNGPEMWDGFVTVGDLQSV